MRSLLTPFLPVLTLLLLPSTITAFSTLHLTLPPSVPPLPPTTTTATLSARNLTLTAPLSVPPSGTSYAFIFTLPLAGTYLAAIHARDFVFAQLAIQVSPTAATRHADAGSRVRAWVVEPGRVWDLDAGRAVLDRVVREPDVGDEEESVSVEVGVKGSRDFYTRKEGFSPASLLKNPMLLIAGLGGLLVFGMPYLLDNMDPELRAEFEEQQRKSPLAGVAATAAGGAGAGGGGSSLQNFDIAGWMAGKTGGASGSG
ncbi:MAG: hypothetical protein M1833_002794, partial [Piccolia ochrophora]